MTAKQWHFKNWSALGWLESGIKLVGIVAAILALVHALSATENAVLTTAQFVQVIVMAILALGLTAAIADRYQAREIFAMAFVVVNVVAHWGMTYALLKVPGPGNLLLIFVGLLLLGDLVKLIWLRASGYTSGGVALSVMYSLVSIFAVGYAIVLLLALANG